MEKAPLIVKTCIDSIIEKNPDCDVIIIDENNYKRYTDIAPIILEKFRNNLITVTHFSDILRFNLLKRHGGLWLDSTIFINNGIDKNVFDTPFFTLRFPKHGTDLFPAIWTIFIIGGHRNRMIFQYMDECYLRYWEEKDYQYDYFLTDYMLRAAYKNNIDGFRDFIDMQELPFPGLHELYIHRFDVYSKQHFEEIVGNNTFNKLTYKEKFKKKSVAYTKKGKLTIYGHLVEKYLE